MSKQVILLHPPSRIIPDPDGRLRPAGCDFIITAGTDYSYRLILDWDTHERTNAALPLEIIVPGQHDYHVRCQVAGCRRISIAEGVITKTCDGRVDLWVNAVLDPYIHSFHFQLRELA